MGKYYDIDLAISTLRAKYKELGNRVLNRLNEECSIEIRKAYEEFGLYQRRVITDLFNDAVINFYDSYTPKRYKRQGDVGKKSGGLFDVLDLKTDETGRVIFNSDNGYMDLYDRTALHSDRNGGSLFENVFVNGYHGGSTKIAGSKESIWGAHPAPGVPYYRKPGFVTINGKRKWHIYGAWGKRAYVSESPQKYIYRNLIKAESGAMHDELYKLAHKHNDVAVDRVKKEIPQIISEVFN